jgi:RNA polymerase sigma-70 factor (ECF subfamily)
MPSPATTLTQLLALTAAGDHRAFAQVYERTHMHLFGVALRLLGREHAAEDVLQEAFVSIWNNAVQFRPGPATGASDDGQPMGWLIAIVRNKALDALRSHTRRREDELADGDDDDGSRGMTPSALDLLSEAARAMQVERCLDSLDGSHRQSLALAYYQGLSHSEVAAQMGAPLGSVKAWIRRGLDKLKSCLESKKA